MTLCGVLKNILLVVASVVIWGTIIGGLQVFGYGIALAGLVYYGVGYDGIMTYWAAIVGFAAKLGESNPEVLSTSTGRKAWYGTRLFYFVVWILVAGTFLIWIGSKSEAVALMLGSDKAKVAESSSRS